MSDPTEVAPSLSEVAVVAGTTRTTAKRAVAVGALSGHSLTWIDALALRVYATVAPLRFPGETTPGVPAVALRRAVLGATTVREGVERDDMPDAAQLVVTRGLVRLLPDLAGVYVYLDRDLSGNETAEVLPVGRWWNDLRWRMSARASSLVDPQPRSEA